jgi:hypothetical protein
MADQVFNIAKGAFAEKIRDGATSVGIMLLKTAESDATLRDYDTLAAILAGSNVEADFTNYARKTGLTGTVTVDDTNDRVDCDVPDQTWTLAGGASNNTLAKAIVFYQESAADSGRIPMSHHDFAETTTGSDITLQVNASGFARAS